ncbi:Eco57I restriction-modification methylase domain-containing protein, partial [Acetobacter cibinongensis]
MSLFDDQLSLFSSSILDSTSELFWGELEGEDSPLPSSITETPLVIPQADFRLLGTRGLAGAWKDRARDNIAAIKLLSTLEGEDRNAIPDEQAVLSRFIGFGASELANTLLPRGNEPYRSGWESLGKELEAACSETDHAALARSTQYAHYTPEYIVTALWNMLVKRGFQGGSVLEPGCGVGQFKALRPERLEGRIAFTGIEMDSIAARMARKLFPKQWIRQEDFTKVTLATTYDLAIGNPPFSNRQVNAAEHRELRGFSLHDWFIARAISALRPGGFAAFVTSRHTLDKTEQKARQHIAEEADLLGAVRLPAGAMSADAGTEVVLDLLVFRKRMIGELPGDQTWLETAFVPDSDKGRGPLRINRYFLENPAQV